jgi:hypothetical protein
MKTFGWRTRLKYALLAGLAAWLTGWLICFPIELQVARRYVDGNASLMPEALAKGLVVWAGFTLFMAMAGFLPLVLPVLLLVPPRWIVRWRLIFILGMPVAAVLAIYKRMGYLNLYHFHHPEELKAFFFTGPNVFVIGFSLALALVYVILAQRRLKPGAA